MPLEKVVWSIYRRLALFVVVNKAYDINCPVPVMEPVRLRPPVKEPVPVPPVIVQVSIQIDLANAETLVSGATSVISA